MDRLYKYFTVFEWIIYFLIFTWILVISLVNALSKRSLKTFFKTFWIHISQILNDFSLPHKPRKPMETILSAIWLLSCTVLLAAFSGHVRNRQLIPKPVVWIDSWQDLYERKDMIIETSEIMSIVFYIANFKEKDDMAKNFKARTKIIKEEEFYNGHKSIRNNLDYQGLVDGKVAIVFDRDLLHAYKDVLVEKYKLQEDRDFHISDYGDITQPVFTTINRWKIDQDLADIWNKVIDILRESGILKFHHDRNINTTTDIIRSRTYKQIKLEQIIGAFDIGGIVSAVSLLILLIEYFVFYNILIIIYKYLTRIKKKLVNIARAKIYLVKLNIYLMIWKINKLANNYILN